MLAAIVGRYARKNHLMPSPMPSLTIDGNTRLIGIAGHPIAQVLAPIVLTGLLRHNRINAVCVPLHVEPGGFAALLAGLRGLHNLVGVIATVPHKQAAAALADEQTPRARLARAANVLRRSDDGRWTADMLDGVGFLRGLAASGHTPKGKRVLVAGAGGVATAICFALAEAGVAEIALFDPDTARAEDLLARLRAAGAPARLGSPDAAGYELVINATPLGMTADDPMAIDPACIDPGTVAADVVTKPAVTRFLQAAQARGCAIMPGARMTEYQMTAMAEFYGFAGDFSGAALREIGLG